MSSPDRNRAELVFLKWRLAPLLWDGSVTNTPWFRNDDSWTQRVLHCLQSLGFAFEEGSVVHGHVVRLELGSWVHVCGAVNLPLALARALAEFASDASRRCLLPCGHSGESLAVEWS